MSAAWQIDGAAPNLVPATLCGAFRNPLRRISQIDPAMRAVQGLYPRNTAAHAAALSGLKARACEYVLAGDTDFSRPPLVRLLRSPVGAAVLDALLGDAPPDWRAAELRLIRIGELERQLIEHKRSLESLRRQVGE